MERFQLLYQLIFTFEDRRAYLGIDLQTFEEIWVKYKSKIVNGIF
jgi:hypothetical protein